MSATNTQNIKKEKERIEKGFVPGVQQAGIQNFTVLGEDGNPLIAPGGSMNFGAAGDVRTTTGAFRMVDGSMLDKDIKAVENSESTYMKMMDMFIRSGDDRLAYKYLSKFADHLPSGRTVEQFESVLGYKIGSLKSLTPANATPSFLRFTNRNSEEFTKGIQKLKVICEARGFVFSNMKQELPPEVPSVAMQDKMEESADGPAGQGGIKPSDVISAFSAVGV